MNIRCLQKFLNIGERKFIFKVGGLPTEGALATEHVKRSVESPDTSTDKVPDNPKERAKFYEKSKAALQEAINTHNGKVIKAAQELQKLVDQAEKGEEELRTGVAPEAEIKVNKEVAIAYKAYQNLIGIIQVPKTEGAVETAAPGAEVATGGKSAPKEAGPVVVQAKDIPEGRDAFVAKYFGDLGIKENRKKLMDAFRVVIPELKKASPAIQSAARQLEGIVTKWDSAEDTEKPKFALQAATAYHNILHGQITNLTVPRKEPKPDLVKTQIKTPVAASTGGDVTADISEFASATPQHKPRMAEMEDAYRDSLEPPMRTTGSTVVGADIKTVTAVEPNKGPEIDRKFDNNSLAVPVKMHAPNEDKIDRSFDGTSDKTPAVGPKPAPTTPEKTTLALEKTSKEFIESSRFPDGFKTPEARVKSYDSALTIIANEVKGDAKLMTAATVLKERITNAKKSVGEAEAEELAKGCMRSLYSLLKGVIPASLKDVAPAKPAGPSATDGVARAASTLSNMAAAQAAPSSSAPTVGSSVPFKPGAIGNRLNAVGNSGSAGPANAGGAGEKGPANAGVNPEAKESTTLLQPVLDAANKGFKTLKAAGNVFDKAIPFTVTIGTKTETWTVLQKKFVENRKEKTALTFTDPEGTVWVGESGFDDNGNEIMKNVSLDRNIPEPAYAQKEAVEHFTKHDVPIETVSAGKQKFTFVDRYGLKWEAIWLKSLQGDPMDKDYTGNKLSIKKIRELN